MTTARPRPWRLTTATRRQACHSRVPFHPDTGSFADYAAGRMDRLGRDLLIQVVRGPGPPSHQLHNALLVAEPIDAATVTASVAWLRPDIVWIHAVEPIEAHRAARLLATSGRNVVIIDDELSAAEELGLLRVTR